MGDIRASSMLHELSRWERASMADTDNTNLWYRISVQEPGNGFPVWAVPGRRYVRHLRKRRSVNLVRSLGFGRLSHLHLGFLRGTGCWITRFCFFFLGMVCIMVIVIVIAMIGFYGFRGSTVLWVALGIICFVTWTASRVAAAATTWKDEGEIG